MMGLVHPDLLRVRPRPAEVAGAVPGDDLVPDADIPDWGGAHATFEIVTHDAPHVLVHRSTRGTLRLSWAIALHAGPGDGTRVHLRLRLAGVRRRRLAELGGGLLDLLTVAGLAAGLRERVGGGRAGRA